MGALIVEKAVSALKNAGFRTQRAYPGSKIPAITQVVAAVQIAEMDFVTDKSTLEVKLLCPHSLGAAACEDDAILAAQALQGVGFSCRIGAVEFDGRAGIFCISCRASLQEYESGAVFIPFKIGAVNQNWVVSFSAQRIADETNPELTNIPWTVRLEQFFPIGSIEDTDPTGGTFTLTNGSEIYHGCKWTSHQRTTEAGGIRQIREGTATHRTTA